MKSLDELQKICEAATPIRCKDLRELCNKTEHFRHTFSPETALKLIAENRAMREVLMMLVNLKEHKDRSGKDEFYERHQPYAWSSAIETLAGLEISK